MDMKREVFTEIFFWPKLFLCYDYAKLSFLIILYMNIPSNFVEKILNIVLFIFTYIACEKKCY